MRRGDGVLVDGFLVERRYEVQHMRPSFYQGMEDLVNSANGKLSE